MASVLPVTVPPGTLTHGLKTSIEKAVADIVPAGKSGAILAIAGAEGATITVATRLGNNWTLAADATAKWSGDVSGRVMLMGTW